MSMALFFLILALGAVSLSVLFVDRSHARKLLVVSMIGLFGTVTIALALKPAGYGLYVIAAIAATVPAIGGFS